MKAKLITMLKIFATRDDSRCHKNVKTSVVNVAFKLRALLAIFIIFFRCNIIRTCKCLTDNLIRTFILWQIRLPPLTPPTRKRDVIEILELTYQAQDIRSSGRTTSARIRKRYPSEQQAERDAGDYLTPCWQALALVTEDLRTSLCCCRSLDP